MSSADADWLLSVRDAQRIHASPTKPCHGTRASSSSKGGIGRPALTVPGLAGSLGQPNGHSDLGMAVTGTADPAALLRIDAGQPGLPLSLTKPIGTGVLNAWHKATGQVSVAAVEVMTTLNGDASRQAPAAGISCATDATGFGLLYGCSSAAAAASTTTALVRYASPQSRGR
jgi:selenide,water dikinase